MPENKIRPVKTTKSMKSEPETKAVAVRVSQYYCRALQPVRSV